MGCACWDTSLLLTPLCWDAARLIFFSCSSANLEEVWCTVAEAVFSQLGRITLCLKSGITGKGRWLSFSKYFRGAEGRMNSRVIEFKWSRT